MASKHRITCINKSDRQNPHERIVSIGGINHDNTRWRISQARAIEGIETGKWEFYVFEKGVTADIIISVSSSGNKYLKTVNDGLQPDNLLNLPECP
jgi:hypothetical protein